MVSISGRLSPHHFEMFSISPLQSYSFRCGFSNNSVITFLEGCFPSSFVAEVVIFFLILYSNDLSSILSSEGMVMLLSSLITSNCEDRVLFVLIHLTGVLYHLFNIFSSHQVFFSFLPESCLNYVILVPWLCHYTEVVIFFSFVKLLFSMSFNVQVIVMFLVPLF